MLQATYTDTDSSHLKYILDMYMTIEPTISRELPMASLSHPDITNGVGEDVKLVLLFIVYIAL